MDLSREAFIKGFKKGDFDDWLEEQGKLAKDAKSRGGLAFGALLFLAPGPGALLAIAAIRKNGFGVFAGLPARLLPLRGRRLSGLRGLFRALLDNQRSAVEGYTDDYESAINNALRSGSGRFPEEISLIDRAIESQPPLNTELKVYRGVGEDVVRAMTLFDNFTERGYTSTSHSFDIADDYAGEFIEIHGVEGRLVEIRIPRGSRVLNLRDHPQFQDTVQQEVILPRNAEFKVLGLREGTMVLEYVPPRTSALAGPSAGEFRDPITGRKVVPEFNSLDDLPLLRNPETPLDAIDRVNPGRDAREFQENCHYVVNALELRGRGYDVTAMPVPVGGSRSPSQLANDWIDPATGKSPKWTILDKTPPTPGMQARYTVANVEEATRSWAPGSRGFIYTLDPTGTGHVFNIYKGPDGRIQLLDGQFGVDLAFQIPSADEIGVMRSNDLTPRLKRILLQVTGPQSTVPDTPRDTAILRRLRRRPKNAGPELSSTSPDRPLDQDEVDRGLAEAENQRQLMNELWDDYEGGFRHEDSREALENYSDTHSLPMNLLKRDPEEFLREYGDEGPSFAPYIIEQNEALERLLEETSLQRDVVVARGVDYFPDLEAGSFFADPGFLSTTTDLELAKRYSANGWLYIIKAPQGTPAVPGRQDFESELILAPGTYQRVLHVDRVNKIVYTEVVDPPERLGSTQPDPVDVESGLIRAERQRERLETQLQAQLDRLPHNSPEREAWEGYINSSEDMNNLKRDPEAFARSERQNFARLAERRGGVDWVEYFARQNAYMEGLFEKNRLTEDIVVARGVQEVDFNNVRHFDFRRLRPGEFLTDPGFLSTTTEIEIADDFSGRHQPSHGFFPPPGENGWVLVIKVPKGTGALPGDSSQSEIILPPGRVQRVLHVDVETRTVYTEIVNPPEQRLGSLTPEQRAAMFEEAELAARIERARLEAAELRDDFGDDDFPTPIRVATDPGFNQSIADAAMDTVSREWNELVEEALQSVGLGNQLRVESSVYEHPRGGTGLDGVILDRQGREVGVLRRHFRLDEDDGKLCVSHSEFILTPPYQGQGIATAMNRLMETWYRQNGVHRIELHAGLDIGGYTWAKQGYGWGPDVGKERIKGIAYQIQDQVRRYLASGRTSPEVLEEIDNMIEFVNTLPRELWPTPYDLAMVGYTPGATTWPGKEGMLGSNWQGVKYL